MAKVAPISIDINKGKLPNKPKGIEMVECKTIEETRRDQLQRLTAGFRLFSHFGFDEGVAGRITLRDPEFSDHFWVNPLGVTLVRSKCLTCSLSIMMVKLFKVKDLLILLHLQSIQDFIRLGQMLTLQLIHIHFMVELFQLLENCLILFLKTHVLFMKGRQYIIIFLEL